MTVEDGPDPGDRWWGSFGHATGDPCVICGAVGDNRLEPRFGYAVCREHARTRPAEAREAFRVGPMTAVPNDGVPGVGTLLSPATEGCPRCGAPPSEFEVRNHDLKWHDGDVHCRRCGAFVRRYDAG
jgi:hypothetical protein